MTSQLPLSDHENTLRPPRGGAGRPPVHLGRPVLASVLAFVFAASAHAQPAPVEGVTVQGAQPATACKPNDLDCLNAQLKAAATAGPPTAPDTSVQKDAQTPSRSGTFSQAATAQRLGKNFGKSAQPYRPPAPAYAKPLIPPTGTPR